MKIVEKTLIRQVHDRSAPGALNLGLGEPGFPTPAPIIAHVRGHLQEWSLGYTPNEGLGELRQKIAETESAAARFSVPPERVVVTVGSEEALFMILLAAVEPGDEVLVPDPGYPAYPSIVRLAVGRPISYPLSAADRFRLRSTAILERINSRTRAIVLNSPNNPTGSIYTDGELEALAEGLRGSDILVVSDECYRSLSYGAAPASIQARYEDTCVVNSLSKSHSMTGWRLGWAIVPPRWLKSLAACHQLGVTCASAVSQKAAVFALGGGAEAACAANREELRRRGSLALAGLDRYAGWKAAAPEGGFYIFVDAAEDCARIG